MGLLQRIDAQLGLFQRMGEHAGVGFEGASPFALEQDMRRAVTRCIACPHSEACRQWLGAGAAGPYPDFCPNAAFLARYGRAAGSQRDSLAA